MSADNWTTCPKCKDTHSAKLAAMFAKVVEAYGKVTVAEFDALRANYDAAAAKPLPQTFREDYEFSGAAEGQVTADYHGSCSACGLEVAFDHSVAFYPEG